MSSLLLTLEAAQASLHLISDHQMRREVAANLSVMRQNILDGVELSAEPYIRTPPPAAGVCVDSLSNLCRSS